MKLKHTAVQNNNAFVFIQYNSKKQTFYAALKHCEQNKNLSNYYCVIKIKLCTKIQSNDRSND